MRLAWYVKARLKQMISWRSLPRFDAIFADVWKTYCVANAGRIPSLLEKLCAGMDEVSREVAETVLYRYVSLAPVCNGDALVRYVPSALFTANEKKLQHTFRNKMLYLNNRGWRLEDKYYGLSVFACDNGLDFLPPGVVTRLRDNDIVDGGAFIGDSAMVFSKYAPRRIFCFEPSADNWPRLQQTITANQLNTVHVVKAGLARASGVAAVESDASMSRVVDRGAVEIQVRSLDDFCKENDVRPALIKMDIEGAEYGAISGALETIRTQQPILIISVYHSAKDFFEIKPMLQELNPRYNFMLRRLDPFHPTNETVLLAY
jgi:FkbM family methyltransferase